MVNEMEEGRKRVLGIMASILVSRHLKAMEDLHDSPPRTEALVGSAVQWAERLMRRNEEPSAIQRTINDGRELRRNSDFGVAAGDGRKRPDGNSRKSKLSRAKNQPV
jgi:hypothetical protein